MRKNYFKTCIAATMAAGFMLGGQGQALAAEEQEFSLEPVLVTAQRRETRELDTPATVTVITAQELRDTGRTSVFEALDNVIGFSSDSYTSGGGEYGGHASRIIMRGLERGTLVLVNGAPLNLLNNNSTFGIPVEAVDRIEIVKGSNATLYGAEALGGVVNIITKKPDGSKKTVLSATVGNYTNKASASTQFDKVFFYIERDNMDAVDSINRRDIPYSTYGKKEKSHKNSAFFSSQFNDRLSFNWAYSDSTLNRSTYTKATDKLSNTYKYDPDRRNNINLIYEDKDNKFKSTLSYNNRKSRTYSYTASTNKWTQSSTWDLFSIGFDSQKTWDFRDGRDSFTAGLTYAHENYEDLKTKNSALYKNAVRNSIAFYGSYNHAFSDKFSTILGLRGHFLSDFATSEDVYLPQVQTLYKINDKTSWYINVGKSFLMPPLNQYFDEARTDFSSLKPQKGWTYETGLKYFDKKQSVKLAIFHMDIKDKFAWIQYGAGSHDRYLANEGDFRNTGIEVEYTRTLDKNWKTNLGFTLSNPESNESGNWQQVNARFQVVAGVTYNKSKFTANLNYMILGDRQEASGANYYINGTRVDIPDRINLSANLQYKASKDHSFALSFNNLLDRENSLNKYHYLDLPFNWTLTYNYSF